MKKRTKKLLLALARSCPAGARQGPKVFGFFFSKKKIFLLFCLCAPAFAEPPLRAGILDEAPPYVVHGADHRFAGFSVDLFRLIAARMGREIVFTSAPMTALVQGLARGTYDVLPGPIEATPEHSGQMLLLEGYTWSQYSFGTRRGEEIGGLADLRGKRLAVRAGSQYAEWAMRNAPHYGFTIWPAASSAAAAAAVLSGAADASLSGSPVQAYMTARDPGFRLAFSLPETRTHQSAAVGLSQAELREEMEDALKCLKLNGTVARLSRHWFGREPDAEDLENLLTPGYGVPGLAGYDPKPRKTHC